MDPPSRLNILGPANYCFFKRVFAGHPHGNARHIHGVPWGPVVHPTRNRGMSHGSPRCPTGCLFSGGIPRDIAVSGEGKNCPAGIPIRFTLCHRVPWDPARAIGITGMPCVPAGCRTSSPGSPMGFSRFPREFPGCHGKSNTVIHKIVTGVLLSFCCLYKWNRSCHIDF